MAASHRTPLMRDQWRAEDDDRDDRHHRERYHSHSHNHSYSHRHRGRRRSSPARASSTRQGGADAVVKLKGRATADRAARPALRARVFEEGNSSPEEIGRRLSRSPERDYNREVPTKLPGKSSDRSSTIGQSYRRDTKVSNKRKRSRSRSSLRNLFSRREERRQSRTSVSSGRHSRADSPISRRREAAYLPLSSPRADHHSSYDDISATTGRPTRDSYVPSTQRLLPRSPVPDSNRSPSLKRRRSRSAGRNSKPKKGFASVVKEISLRDRTSRKHRGTISSTYTRNPQSRDNSPLQNYSVRRRRSRSLSLSSAGSRPPYRKRRPSRLRVDFRTANDQTKKMQSSTQPIQSILDDNTRPPSPPRPIPSFDSDSHDSGGVRETFPLHGMKANEVHGAIRPGRPQVDTRQSYSTSPQWTPTSSHHGSPQSGSPFSHGRGGWGGQPQHFHGQPSQNMNAYSPPFRQNGFPPQSSPQGQYFSNNQPSQYNGPPQQIQQGFHNQGFRGGHTGYRGNHFGQGQDRRFSGPGPSNYGINPPRGRGGLFQNLQWTASGGSRGRGQTDPGHVPHHQSGQSQSPPQLPQQQPFDQPASLPDDDDNPFRPSKDLQVEDQSGKDNDTQSAVSPGSKKMLPPTRQTGSSQAKESSKFSFAFKKAKTAPSPAAKTVPDLAQKLKESARKENLLDLSKSKNGPRATSREPILSRPRIEHRAEPRIDRRDDRREREYRDDYRDERRSRDDRHNERDYRDQRRPDYRDDRRPERSEREQKRDRERERSPELRIEKKIMKRLKPRPTLPTEFAESISVYYRKPGNESVVGSGTYGKVFKAIHVYTKQLAALKKIRMEGEKDGFPVTAVREIKLLQSLKHDNVVCLQEVMVENNDCFMVFEYLSHDLTGLLNHPTFKLEHSHKKHLGKQLFEGLNYLHRRGVLHRDIKAANILVSNLGQLKLADFGLARFFSKHGQPDYTNRVITIWYRSPELLLGETQYGPAVDIWSAACVMIEIFTRHAIFPGDGGEINQLDKIYNVLGTPTISEWPRLADMAWFELLRPTERRSNTFAEKYQERLTPHAFELLQAMFLYDPSKRPTAGDVLEHPYFTTEDPAPKQAIELENLEGDWHEFESKALRKENERKNQEARRAVRQEEKEKEKRRASGPGAPERDPKRLRPSSSHDTEPK